MNKYLMMTAAACLGAISPAFAADHSSKVNVIQFLSSGGSSYCDGLSFYKASLPGVGIELGAHLLTGCGDNNTEIAGQKNKKSFDLTENWSSAGSTFVYDISKPIKTGSAYTTLLCSQVSCFEVAAGTYKLGYDGAAVRGRPSLLAKIAATMAAHKAARR